MNKKLKVNNEQLMDESAKYSGMRSDSINNALSVKYFANTEYGSCIRRSIPLAESFLGLVEIGGVGSGAFIGVNLRGVSNELAKAKKSLFVISSIVAYAFKFV